MFMFKKIIVLTLLVSIFSAASSVSVYAQATLNDDETQTVGVDRDSQTEETPRKFVKKEKDSIFQEKEGLAAYQKQKAQGKRFSTGTKILIGVGVAAAVIGVVVFLASRDKVEPFKNGVLN